MFELHLLHANDFEGGKRTAFNRADEFAAIWDILDQQNANTLKLSSGDAVLAGPIFDAGGESSEELDSVLQEVNAEVLNLEPGTLAGFESDSGRPDISILHAMGMDAVTVGNHEFDAGPDGFAGFLKPDAEASDLASAEWLGTFFPYLATNLDFTGDAELADTVVDERDGFRTSASFTPDPANDVAGATSDNKLASATTVDVNGETIGVVGATTQAFNAGLISDTGGITVEGEPGGDDIDLLAEQIQADVDRLEQNGVNKIVVQTHLQAFALENQLAPKLSGVDILMAGGSNAISANDFAGGAGQPNSTTELNPGDEAAAPYPKIIDGADGSPTALVSTDGNWEYVGNLVVEFDENGVIKPDSIDPAESGPYAATQATIDELVQNTDTSFTSAEEVFAEGTVGQQARDIVDATTQIVREQDGNVAGITDVYLEGARTQVRAQETNLGNLSAEANLWYARQFEDAVDVSFKNGGGIRGRIADIVNNADGSTSLVPPQADPEIGKPDGGVSQISIASALSFNNALTLVTLTQEELVEVIESGTRGPGGQTGGFGQLAGVRYSYDPTAPEGERVTELKLVDGDGAPGQPVASEQVIVEDGQFVGDADATIRMVTLNFLANNDSVIQPIADSADANRIDLNNPAAPDGLPDAFTFSKAGREQDAMAEFMNQFHGTAETAYAEADTAEIADTRIDNVLYDQVAQLFVTYLGRAPSPGELTNAVDTVEDGDALRDVAAELAGDQAALDFLSNPTTDGVAISQFLHDTYQNAFNRAPSVDGLNFWTTEIRDRVEAGENLEQLPLDIISGAQNTELGDDLGAVRTRGEVARDFAASLAASGESFGTTGNRKLAESILDDVGADARDSATVRSTVDLLRQAPADFQATQVGRFENDVFAEGAAEIVAHDPGTQRLFASNGNQNRLDVLDMRDPAEITRVDSIVPTEVFPDAGGFTHVEVNDGVVAVGVENSDGTANGRVAFFDAQSLELLNSVEVGVLPDNVQFSPDGNTVMSANEGEQIDEDEDGTPSADPQGSVSIIDIAGGVTDASVETLDFTQFNGQEDALREQGVRIFPGRAAGVDLEPEYVAISPDNSEARVALQENNAFATVDLTNNQITGIQPLGTKDFSQPGQGIDAINDGRIDIETLPAEGLYQPDQIAAYSADGNTYYVSANEGDDRDFDVSEAGEANLSRAAQSAVEANGIGELEISNIDGDTDGDGEIEALHAFGGRSFAIWDSEGNRVFDSGDEFEKIMAQEIPDGFNSDDEENDKDSESDEAGAEVEGVALGTIDGTMHAFIGLEKPGGVMIYDVSKPSDAQFVDYITNRNFDVPLTESDGTPNSQAGDSGPEGLAFIAAEDSPTGEPVLAVGNEISGSVTLWEFG